MEKKPRKRKASLSAAAEPQITSMLEGLGHYANLEWQDYLDGVTPAGLEPKMAFVSGYIFGAALGLAMSPRQPTLVQKFAKQFREERGWNV